MEGEHEHTPEIPAVVAPVIDTGNELVAPVIDHTEKLAQLEAKTNQQESDFYRRISETEDQLRQAIEAGGQGMSERITALESKLEALLAKAEEVPEEELPNAVDFEVPPIEDSPAPPEKMPRGIRARRKARRNKQ